MYLYRLDSVYKLNCMTFDIALIFSYKYSNWLRITIQESALDMFYVNVCFCIYVSWANSISMIHMSLKHRNGIEPQLYSLVFTCVPSPHFTRVHSDDLHSLLSSRFPPHMVPPHHSLHTTGIPHPAIVTPNVKQESSHSDISSLNSS